MPMHMYPYGPGLHPAQLPRSKRRQVKNACTNCQKACKKCDDARPCLRCVKYGISEECVDSQRKERKKGIKRGPYKKRDGRDHVGKDVEPLDVSHQIPVSDNPLPSTGGTSIMSPFGYSPSLGQYPPMSKPDEGVPLYHPQCYLGPFPPSQSTEMGSDIDGSSFSYYPAYFTQVPAMSYPQYMMSRPDGQATTSNQYNLYSGSLHQKLSASDGNQEDVSDILSDKPT